MTNEEIHNYIELMNLGDNSTISIYSTTENIDRTYIYDCSKKIGFPYKFWFIKNKNKKYVSAVLDMGYLDLHVYTMPNYRNKGYMYKALKHIVLPDIFTEREEQRVTIENTWTDEAVEKIIGKLGFKSLEGVKYKYELKKVDFVNGKRRLGI